ncbi:MAG: UbiA family prenyltransferase [Gammaproteobacteria bacterium]|nr:UbiA family prenyltransferase [Gammaproteobacteria bacterium]
MFFFICVTFGLALALMLNTLAIKLAFIGLILAVVYPFTKRWIHAPQLILGFAFAWGMPMAYAAIQEKLSWECWYLFTLVILLAIAYDTLYAMVDKEDDMTIGIKSTAIWFGRHDKTIVFVLQLVVWLGLLLFGFLQHYSWMFDAWIACSLGFFIYQRKLLREQTTQKYFQAFLNHHWFVLWVWIGFVMG